MAGRIGKRSHIIRAIAIVTCFVIGAFIYSCAGRIETGEMDTADDHSMSRTGENSAVESVVISEGATALQIGKAFISMGEKESEMYISWQAGEDGPRILRCAEDKTDIEESVPIMAHRTEILRNTYRFKVKLSGLEPGKRYWYEIGSLEDQEDAESEAGIDEENLRSFVAPETDSEVSFVYLGDPQFDKSVSDYEAWGKLTERMYEKAPYVDFAIIGGDMVNIPTRKDHWNEFLDNCTVFEELPVMTIPGNHEGVTSNNTYKKLFHNIGNGPDGEAFYYFDRGSCRFIMLDSSFLTKARQVAMGKALWTAREREVESWLKKTLEDSGAKWKIIVTHHPIYGMHDMFTVSKEIRELWLPIMKAGGADLVLCGHQHAYMRTRDMDGIVHIMGVSGAKRSHYYTGINAPAYSEYIYSAGPNYQIIKVTDAHIEITSYNEKSSIIDAARIEKDINLPYFRTFW